jgi:MerR family transcriptional regulator, thiopeptide resistance regulator
VPHHRPRWRAARHLDEARARECGYGAQVSEVARMTGVSVRALHHYDEIGLLIPRERSDAGYRRYDDADLLRLPQILIGREQGLSLEEIRRSLDDPRFDHRQALLDLRRRR